MELTEHTSGKFKATRHKYVFNMLGEGGTGIDADTVSAQSRKQVAEDSNQKIIVHHHREGESCEAQAHDAYGCSLASQLVV